MLKFILSLNLIVFGVVFTMVAIQSYQVNLTIAPYVSGYVGFLMPLALAALAGALGYLFGAADMIADDDATYTVPALDRGPDGRFRSRS